MKMIMSNNSEVSINGKSYKGKDVSISNGTLTVDGVVQDKDISHDVDITVTGDIDILDLNSGRVEAHSIGQVSTMSGGVRCGDISGSVTTMSGDVRSGRIAGNIETMSGDIIHK